MATEGLKIPDETVPFVPHHDRGSIGFAVPSLPGGAIGHHFQGLNVQHRGAARAWRSNRLAADPLHTTLGCSVGQCVGVRVVTAMCPCFASTYPRRRHQIDGRALDGSLEEIQKYIVSPKADQASPTLKRILANRKDENRKRRQRLVAQLAEAIVQGGLFALGQPVRFKASSPVAVLEELLNHLITNTYSKLLYLKVRQADPIAEIKAVLTADELATHAATPGDAVKPLSTGQPNVPAPMVKTTKLIRAAEVSSKAYLETEADVNAYVDNLKTQLVAAIRADHIARIQ